VALASGAENIVFPCLSGSLLRASRGCEYSYSLGTDPETQDSSKFFSAAVSGLPLRVD
jgi:hypothetical protein